MSSAKKRDPIQKIDPSFIKRNLFFFVSFAVLILYNASIVRGFTFPITEGERYSFHLVDFSMGFCAKFLQGAIFNLFVDEPTVRKASVYELILLVLLFAGIAFFINAVSKRISAEYRAAFAVMTAFFITGPLTFAIFSYQPGMPDVNFVLVAVLFFLFYKVRFLRFCTPLLCFAGVMFHYGFLITYFPLFFFVILYDLLDADEKTEKKKLFILLILNTAAAGGLFLYFSSTQDMNLVYTQEEFDTLLSERGADTTKLLDYYLYGDTKMGDRLQPVYDRARGLVPGFLPEKAQETVYRVISSVLMTIEVYSIEGFPSLILTEAISLIIILPAVVFLYRTLIVNIRPFGYPFLIAVTAFFPAGLIAAFLMSRDWPRWTAHIFTVLFIFVFYTVYRGKDEAMKPAKQMMDSMDGRIVFSCFLVYCLSVINPYT